VVDISGEHISETGSLFETDTKAPNSNSFMLCTC